MNNKLATESEAVASFLKIVNEIIRGGYSANPMSDKTALKFLIARKFDVDRAVQLYQRHEIVRLNEGLANIDIDEEGLKSELNSGKFTILKDRDNNDSAIAIFTAKLHSPQKSLKNLTLRKKIHRLTLQGIVYQLDSALEDILTQRNGIVFIYNMNDSEYSNFDYELCQKILDLLKGAYPAKLKKVLIVSPPLWFRAPFHLLRLIVREKLRDRVWLLKIDQLKDHVPEDVLTRHLGGTNEHDHKAWIDECLIVHKTRYNDFCDTTSAQNLVKSLSQKSGSTNFKRLSFDGTSSIDEAISSQYNNLSPRSSKFGSGAGAGRTNQFDYDDTGISLNQFLDLIRDNGKKGIGGEYDDIVRNEDCGTFLVSSNQINMRKNRYVNVLCYDSTRVVLEPYDLPEGSNPNDPMDYINASYIDGYRQPRAYISTQGPIESTFMDFWRMIWQTSCRVIVMVTLNFENQIMKCDKYWPTAQDRIMNVGVYKIEYVNIDYNDDFNMTHLRLTNTRSEVTRDIWHFQFVSWPDFGVPLAATALLKFRDCILKKQLDAIELTGNTTYPPIVVHCSAGVGRSGTFVTIDICIQKLETTGLVDIRTVVERLRQQRFSSIQTREQYTFCYKAIVEYAANSGLLDSNDLDDLMTTIF